MKITGAKLIQILLEKHGIETIAGIPGGAILPFYDALFDSKIRHVLVRHEQSAGFIAQGLARVSGKAAVCVATSGPGATNLLTAIADAWMDSIPMIAITGQVTQGLIGTTAFQEVDTFKLTTPITKHNFLARSARELLEIVPMAFRIAESGRPGPVAIDLPKDVQMETITISEEEIDAAIAKAKDGSMEEKSWTESDIDRLARALSEAKHPVIYLGGGVIASGASDLARKLAHRVSAPVVSTLMALGAIPPDDELNMGMLGMHGSMATNLLLEETDFLFAIGARFDDRATGKIAEFCPKAKIAHIDIDACEIGKLKSPCIALQGDASEIISALLSKIGIQKRDAWTKRAAQLKRDHSLHYPNREEEPLHPANICRFLGDICDENTIIATDVGQHQMWMAQNYPVRAPRTFLTSGGLGTMGFGLPTAIGASLAAPGKRVVCVSGDGSILMNIQELITLAELNLPVSIVVFNNAELGMVRQQQEFFLKERYMASQFSMTPDFPALGKAFGIRGIKINPKENPLAQLEAALRGNTPCIIEVPVDATANVLPIVPPGAANRDMMLAAAK